MIECTHRLTDSSILMGQSHISSQNFGVLNCYCFIPYCVRCGQGYILCYILIASMRYLLKKRFCLIISPTYLLLCFGACEYHGFSSIEMFVLNHHILYDESRIIHSDAYTGPIFVNIRWTWTAVVSV